MSTRLAVIGAGPGGYAAAFHAADLGMQVTLIDAEPNPGGVCTFRGCIPSKALLHAAKVLDEAKHADAFGVSFGKPSIDVDKLRSWKDAVVKKQTGGLGLLAKARKVTYVQGRASIVDGKTLSVETGKGRAARRDRLHHHRDGLAPDHGPERVDRQPEGARLDNRARAAGRAEPPADRGRRLHRSGARHCLRRARLESHRRRDDRRPSARRRSRPGGRRRQAHGDLLRGDSARDEGDRRQGRQERA